MKKLFFAAALFFFSTIAYGGVTDSLMQLLNKAKTDTAKISLLFQIEAEYMKRDADSGMFYLQQCKKLMDKTKDTANNYRYTLELVLYYHTKGEYETAFHYNLKLIDIAKKKANKQEEARAYRAIFNIYHNLKKYDLAIKYGLYAANLSEEIGDTLSLSINYGNLCWLFEDINQYQKAIYYGEKGIAAGRKYNDVRGLLISLNNTALVYGDINNQKKAIELFKEQLAIARRENIPRSIHKALSNLCLMNVQLGNKEEVLRYAKEYSEYIKESKVYLNKKDLCFKYIINANSFMFENKFQAAEVQVKKGIEIAEADSVMAALQQLYELAANIKFAQHDFRTGAYYLSKWDSIDQLQFDEQLASLSMDLEAKYQTQKKENEILKQQQQLRKRNLWIVLLCGAIILLVLFFFFVFRYFKQRNILLEKEKIIQQQHISKLEKEKQLQATEAILKGQEEERSRIAKDLHDGLGGLLSGVKYSLNDMKENVILSAENAVSFARSIDMLDSGIQELRRIAHNMMPENLVKFGLDTALNDYCNSISKTNVIAIQYSSLQMDTYHADINVSVTVYRIVQELVNNIIKHAKATQAIVQLTKDDNLLHITVEDNGIGFDINKLGTFKSAGWTNIQNRINYLGGKLEVDSNPANGTSVTIEIALS